MTRKRPSRPDASADLRQLPLSAIVPSPRNPRGRLTGLPELAKSITDHGVIVPIVVAPGADGTFDIIDGHRRYAAAILAKETAMPAIVRSDMVGASAQQARLLVNLQREDLTPMEEARGFEGLVELGLGQHAIGAAVGRNQGHVSKRLKLLALPAHVQAAIDDGRLPVNVAVDLARLNGEHVEKVLGAVERGVDVAVALRQARARAARDQDRADAVMIVQLDDVTIVTTSSRRPVWSLTAGPYPVAHLPGAPDHAGEDCHAAVIAHRPMPAADDAGPVARWVTYICTDPARHLGADEPVDAEETSRRAANDLLAAEDAQHQLATAAATRARRAFCAGLVGPRRRGSHSGVARGPALDHLLRGTVIQTLVGECYSPGPASLALAASWVAPALTDPAGHLRPEVAALTGDLLLRWTLGCQLALDELAITAEGDYSQVRVAGPLLTAHLTFLSGAGYTLSDLELEWLAAADGYDAPTVHVTVAQDRRSGDLTSV